MHLDGLVKTEFQLAEELELFFLVFCPAVIRNKLPTVSMPSRGVHVRNMRWTTAPCLVPTSGYPGERKAVEPFCLSQ